MAGALEFKVSLGNTARSCFKIQSQMNKPNRQFVSMSVYKFPRSRYMYLLLGHSKFLFTWAASEVIAGQVLQERMSADR